MKLQVIKSFTIESPQSRGSQSKKIVIESGRFLEGISWYHVPSEAREKIESSNYEVARKIQAGEVFVIYIAGQWILVEAQYVKIVDYRKWFRNF